MQPDTDTIIAVSSPPGRSPRGLIRIAGPQTVSILAQHNIKNLTPRGITPARWNANLPVLVTLFVAPNSYTADDLAELQLPGNPALLERVVQRIIEDGARLAHPGEFTHRAFRAGKIDLTQAEGIAATIAAQSDAQLTAAARLRRGELGQLAESLVGELAHNLALVEAGIDFVDQEDVVPIAPDPLQSALERLIGKLTNLLAQSARSHDHDAPPRVVLAGPPSVGKSTLFNALLGLDRAVTHATPGTTRDAIEHPLTLTHNHRTLDILLIDLAGLDAPTSSIDRLVQAAANKTLRDADLILHIRNDPHHANHPLENILPTNTLRVRTMSESPATPPDTVAVHAPTARGLAELKTAIANRFADQSQDTRAATLTLQPRHESALTQTRASLTAARDRLAQQTDRHALQNIELLAANLRDALDHLGTLGGHLTPDDVIGKVFSTFCVGK